MRRCAGAQFPRPRVRHPPPLGAALFGKRPVRAAVEILNGDLQCHTELGRSFSTSLCPQRLSGSLVVLGSDVARGQPPPSCFRDAVNLPCPGEPAHQQDDQQQQSAREDAKGRWLGPGESWTVDRSRRRLAASGDRVSTSSLTCESSDLVCLAAGRCHQAVWDHQ